MKLYVMLRVPGSVRRGEWLDGVSERMVKGRKVTVVGGN